MNSGSAIPQAPGGGQAATPEQTVAPRSPAQMFLVFTRLALQGFGGVIPVAQRELVERQRWMSRTEFVETLSLGQILPGPNIVNVALMFGDRHFGWRGALAAMAGLMLAPLAVVLALTVLARQAGHLPEVAGALRGMAGVAAGLIASTAWKLAGTLQRNRMGLPACILLALGTVLAIGVLRWPMWMVLAAGVPMGWLWAWWKLKPAPEAVR